MYKYGHISDYIWNIGNLFDGMVRWCVPIFVMISGALLLNEDIEISPFIKKRMLRILPPFIFWSFIYIIFDQFIFNYKPIGIIQFFNLVIDKFIKGSQYHLWFVYMILGLYLGVPILRKFVKKAKNKDILYFLGIWLFTVILRHPYLKVYLPPKMNLDLFTGYIGYLVLGYYLSKNNFKNKIKPILLFLFGTSLIIFGTKYLFHLNSGLKWYFYDYLSPGVIISSVGLFLTIKNIEIKNSYVKFLLKEISNYSFGIYLVHVLVLSIIDTININWKLTNPIISIPITMIICLSVSFAIIYLIRKIKYGKYISG